jgi:TATA-binding protein-associated factor Taf7
MMGDHRESTFLRWSYHLVQRDNINQDIGLTTCLSNHESKRFRDRVKTVCVILVEIILLPRDVS